MSHKNKKSKSKDSYKSDHVSNKIKIPCPLIPLGKRKRIQSPDDLLTGSMQKAMGESS